MRLTARARAARRALLQRFLALSGILVVAALLLMAATSNSHAFSPAIIDAGNTSSAAWNC